MRQIALLAMACFALLLISGCGEIQPDIQYTISKPKRAEINDRAPQSCRVKMSDAEFEKCVAKQLIHYKARGNKYKAAYFEVTE